MLLGSALWRVYTLRQRCIGRINGFCRNLYDTGANGPPHPFDHAIRYTSPPHTRIHLSPTRNSPLHWTHISDTSLASISMTSRNSCVASVRWHGLSRHARNTINQWHFLSRLDYSHNSLTLVSTLDLNEFRSRARSRALLSH